MSTARCSSSTRHENRSALAEPVASLGPFVMNARAEVLQTIRDYQDGRMGQVAE